MNNRTKALSKLEAFNKKQNYDEIISYFDAEQDKDWHQNARSNARHWFIIGSALRKSNRIGEAISCLQKALACEPKNVWIHAELADIFAKSDPELGEIHYRHALLGDQNSRLLARAVNFCARTKNFRLFEDLNKQAADRSGKFSEAWINAASVFGADDLLRELHASADPAAPPASLNSCFAFAALESTPVEFWSSAFRQLESRGDAKTAGRFREFFLADDVIEKEIAEVLKSLSIEAGRALDVGCGTGRISCQLAAAGFAVTGLDFSPVALAAATDAATSQGHSIDFLEQNCFDHFEDNPAGQYDLIVDCFTHNSVHPENCGNLLSHYTNALAPGGVLILIANAKSPQRDHNWDQFLFTHEKQDTIARLDEIGIEFKLKGFDSGFLVWTQAKAS